jgi:hypothetical protein
MRRSKYNAVRTGGYASKAEAARAAELRTLLAAGEIGELQEQPSYVVSPDGCKPISYRPDFRYVENGITVCEDVKGIETAEFRIKAKLFRWKYPGIEFRILRRLRTGFAVEVVA